MRRHSRRLVWLAIALIDSAGSMFVVVGLSSRFSLKIARGARRLRRRPKGLVCRCSVWRRSGIFSRPREATRSSTALSQFPPRSSGAVYSLPQSKLSSRSKLPPASTSRPSQKISPCFQGLSRAGLGGGALSGTEHSTAGGGARRCPGARRNPFPPTLAIGSGH